ncbi:sideroflexin-1 [Lingula anatina]|uniref:Sidoreflexin n=1 Tax=Lingula anatina TaxID=7574 RepID=A0A1S3KD61_LINAN|nr:sideroflexin-1 [Lingula anatina]|eukprot:XP_013420560.1 sideroflexin-1 [Lingula anatina]
MEAATASQVSGGLRINLDEPRYDQNTFSGRAKHFFITTNPLNLFCSNKTLEEAKILVEQYRNGQEPAGLTEDQIWRAKHIYDSAYHPDTKEKMFIIGRMSAQVPMNMSITGCMMTFYKSTPAVIFWQWINQSFNAVVNYTNRSGDHPIPVKHLGLSYVLATGGALVTALGLNSQVHRFPPLIARYVPFSAVAAANCINIPCMRSQEMISGIPVFDENGNRLGTSQKAAKKAIFQVVFSRVCMAMPGMLTPPIIMQRLEKGSLLMKYPWLNAPIQVGLVGAFLVFATPLCCALFPQKSSMAMSHLEPELQEKLAALPNPPSTVYFNKGL